jgi:uncharacterized integral membrane protein
MTTNSGPQPPPADPSTDIPHAGTTSSTASRPHRPTRTSAAWAAVGAGLALLILLIIFMLQNSVKVDVEFLGAEGTIPLGLALLIAAVGGGVVVAVAGVARITQLRSSVRRSRRAGAARP